MEINGSGFSKTLHPVTTDMSQSPTCKLRHAECSDVKLEEQPVSIVMLGPLRSKKCDIRLDNMAVPVPVSKNRGNSSGLRDKLS